MWLDLFPTSWSTLVNYYICRVNYDRGGVGEWGWLRSTSRGDSVSVWLWTCLPRLNKILPSGLCSRAKKKAGNWLWLTSGNLMKIRGRVGCDPKNDYILVGFRVIFGYYSGNKNVILCTMHRYHTTTYHLRCTYLLSSTCSRPSSSRPWTYQGYVAVRTLR